MLFELDTGDEKKSLEYEKWANSVHVKNKFQTVQKIKSTYHAVGFVSFIILAYRNPSKSMLISNFLSTKKEKKK